MLHLAAAYVQSTHIVTAATKPTAENGDGQKRCTIGAVMTAARPKFLFIYFTYSQQTLRVVEAIAGALRDRGCDLREAKIEFTDSRYAGRFSRFPLMHPYRDIFGMVFRQLFRKTGQIRVPDEARETGYDLVCICSPTWWLNPCMPIRSFLESDLAGTLLTRKRFAAVVVCH